MPADSTHPDPGSPGSASFDGRPGAPLTEAAIGAVRAQFPALSREQNGRPYVYLDGPGGTQVPRRTIDAMVDYLRRCNANHEGAFATSEESDAMLAEVHAAAADYLGAADPGEVVFGQNMTTLTFAMSRAIGRTLKAGDEVVVTRLDHDANVAPWLALEEERGVRVRWVGIREEDCTLDLGGLERALGPRTRLVAVGLASNAVGTLNPIPRIVEMAHAAGAVTYVDAVHAAPHVLLDVAVLGTDFLVCSPYKFFGPHLGLLYGRRDRLERLAAYKVRPAPNVPPGKWETGTLPGESLAGLLATFEYLEWLGATYGASGAASGAATRRARFLAAMAVIGATEQGLARRALTALGGVPGLKLRGIVDPNRLAERVPTFAFTLAGCSPREVATELGRRGIAVWDGDYYAYELIRALGLAQSGGMVRAGFVHYNTPAEIDRLVEALGEIAGSRSAGRGNA
ncbi:MAG: cysteine desulfurase-like protein [Candidatus Limnocylindrales bacterium]|jgi:cysteine desulfurase family protein (TIGR01976 family)